MTVKTVNESQERVSGSVSVSVSVSDLQKPKKPLSTKLTTDFGNLVGQAVTKVDRRMVGTKESPKSTKKAKYLHSQILRIREEDSHLGEELGLPVKDSGYLYHCHNSAVPTTDADLFPKPILPSSPLSGKTTAILKASHSSRVNPDAQSSQRV